MANFRNVRIIKEKIIGDKVWQIISFFEDNIKKFDVVYFYKVNAEEMAKELISSKKKIKTFKDKDETLKFFNNFN